MKWPNDLDFGEEVVVIYRETVRNADEDELTLSNGDTYEPDSRDLFGVFRIPD